MFESLLIGVFLVSFISVASAQDLTCGAFTALSEDDQLLLAYGYLEGVQGALDKGVTDILVPPSDPKHPAWWVLPSGLSNNASAVLARKLKTTCQPADKRGTHLLQAFLFNGLPERRLAVSRNFCKQKTVRRMAKNLGRTRLYKLLCIHHEPGDNTTVTG